MKHFIQHRFNRSMLKAAVGFLLLFVGLQPSYGQCVECDSTTTTGWFSSAVGRYSKATGHYAFAGGILSEANGMASLAFGNRVRADGTGSFAIGMFVRAWGTASGVLGTGFSLDDPLVNTQSYSLMVGFGSTKPTLFVGPSNGVNSTGKIGIGNVTDPQAKLHIRADQYDDASLLLEATGSNKRSSILMAGGQAVIGTSSQNHSLSFVTGTTHTRMFINGVNGNVGIGTATPHAPLDVAGEVLAEKITINEEYSLPVLAGSQTQFLRGDGVWAVPSSGVEYWRPEGRAIYFNGNVGIGSTPNERLTLDSPHGRPINFHIGGSQNIYSNAWYNGINTIRSKEGPAYAINFSSSGMYLRTTTTGNANSNISWTQAMVIKSDGKVGIGTINPDFMLTVAGGIHAREVKVTINSGADHVFNENYKLLSLDELETFISQNHHLPGIDSEQDMQFDGVELGSFQIKLLEKIEELTLYIITQQKEIEALKASIIKP